MSLERALDEARDAVLEWRDVRGMPRPRSLGRGEAFRVVRVELSTPYERRSLDAKTDPAPASAIDDEPNLPDPWSIEIDAPRDGREWSQRVPVESHARVGLCNLCKGARRFKCEECDGRGYKTESRYDPITGRTTIVRFVCGTCAGQTTVRCEACLATARVRTVPIVVSATGIDTRRELLDDGSLPAELKTEMRRAPSVCFWNEKSLHSVSGEDPKLAPWGGQRPSSLSSSATAAVETLWNTPGPDDRRVRGFRVDVVEGQVVRFKQPGRELWVWGSPARVTGDDDPVSTGPSAPLIFGAVLMVVAGVGAWWLLR